jgi:hypothetical protein
MARPKRFELLTRDSREDLGGASSIAKSDDNPPRGENHGKATGPHGRYGGRRRSPPLYRRVPDGVFGRAGPASNHEEAMGGVAPELFDETEFPIEVSLHRVAPDIGALIGAPVAV